MNSRDNQTTTSNGISQGGNTRPSASPPCQAHETDPAYWGYLTMEDTILRLQALLEAERAGARIALDSISQLEANSDNLPETQALFMHIKEDETRYCKMLIDQIERLGGVPSKKVGDFYEKCMALENVSERIAFLNRGQGWVVRKIDEMKVAVEDQDLLAALKEMRDTHVRNIDQAETFIQE